MLIYYYIYITTNNINGKKYIGQHSTENINDGYLGSGKIIRQAINLYGRENFTKEILEFANNKKELDQLEIKYIEKYNASESPSFYNITRGGGGTVGVRMTEEQKEQLSRTLKRLYAEGKIVPPMKGKFGKENPHFGHKLTPEQKKHLSDVALSQYKTGVRQTVKWSEERKKNYSEFRKEKYASGEYVAKGLPGSQNPMYGKTGCLSPRFGAHFTDEEKKIISNIAKEGYRNGRIPSRQGKQWDEESKRKMSESHKGLYDGENNPNFGKGRQYGKKVFCVEKEKFYNSIAEASKENNCWPHQISKCLKGERESVVGLHWKYASQVNPVPSSDDSEKV